jgi:heme-degrading monooxygenase HmoA
MVSTRQPFASGNWIVSEGKEDEFVTRWLAFLEWTKASSPGLSRALLIRDAENPRHFVSFAEWDSPQSMSHWRSQPDFSTKFGACRALCDDFRGGDYMLAGSIIQ